MTKHESTNEKWDVQLRKGTLELVVLAALRERRIYGLELLKTLHRFETMKITEGTLYPLLDRLKRDQSVKASWHQEGESRPRKYYELTEQGAEKLATLAARWSQSVEDIQFLLDHPGPQALDPKGEHHD